MLRSWKGVQSSRVELDQDVSGCGRDFSPGDRYIFTGTSGCSATFKLEQNEPPDRLQAIFGPPTIVFGDTPRDRPGAGSKRVYLLRAWIISGATIGINALRDPGHVREVYKYSVWPFITFAAGAFIAILLVAGAIAVRRRLMLAWLFAATATVVVPITLMLAGKSYMATPIVSTRIQWEPPNNE